MVAFRESLTIAIRGDSSDLSRELDGVGEKIAGLSNRLAQFNRSGQEVGRMAERFGASIRPLQTISLLLDRIIGQIRQLARTPVVIDIRPAVRSLAVLGALIDATAAKLARLSAIGAIGGTGGGPVRAFAGGGFVSGPSGVDRVPAMLTAGEFVIRRQAVRQLGTAFLSALNQASPVAQRSPTIIAPLAAGAASVTNNLGGITVNVSQAAEVEGMVRDLQLRETAGRVRRG